MQFFRNINKFNRVWACSAISTAVFIFIIITANWPRLSILTDTMTKLTETLSFDEFSLFNTIFVVTAEDWPRIEISLKISMNLEKYFAHVPLFPCRFYVISIIISLTDLDLRFWLKYWRILPKYFEFEHVPPFRLLFSLHTRNYRCKLI